MGSGGSGNSTQNVKSESVTTNLPAYAQPYFTNMMDRGQALSYQEYVPYQGEQVAGFTPLQKQAQQNAAGLQAPAQFGQATDIAQQAGVGALAAGHYDPTTFGPNQIAAPQTFGTDQANAYMSPYIQNVLDVQKQQALRDAQVAQLTGNLDAARQGTYGGARQPLATTERERNLGSNMANIEATGLQSAYQAAQAQFNADMNRGLTVDQANQNARQAAAQATEQSKQFGVSSGLQGLQEANQSAQTLGTLGQQKQASDIQRIQAQDAAGAEQQALQQQQDTTSYQNFLTQQQYPMQQLSYYDSLLRGLPITPNSTTTTTQPTPSMLSQIGGAGLGALSLAKLMG